MMSRMRRVRARLAEYHSVDRLRMAGVDIFFGEARFVGPEASPSATRDWRSREALIATGARPNASNIPGLEDIGYLTSETIFGLEALPERLAIIGGGPLGCEMAQAFCRMGSRVILLQDDPKFLPREERDAAELLSLSLSGDGVETRLNTTVTAAHMEGGDKLLETINNEIQSSVTVDEVLLSVGRIPNVEGLCVDVAAIQVDTSLGVTVDDFLRTSNPNVYAAGDVCMVDKFTNVAEVTGRMAVQNAFPGRRSRQSLLMVPWCTFCDPEIAHIGLHVWEREREGSLSERSRS